MKDEMQMTDDVVLANATLVLADECVTGSLLIRDGQIAEIDQGASVPRGAVDCGGDHLAPGLIEVHTDNLERHMKPRPKVAWPLEPAILAHDAELADAIAAHFPQDADRMLQLAETAGLSFHLPEGGRA